MLHCPVRLRPLIVLLGDSLTQQGFGFSIGGERTTGWASKLAHEFRRRADVLNRGYSGYNSRHICQEVIDSNDDESAIISNMEEDVLFCTVFLGANDAALPGERQHVPLNEYETNLERIVAKLR